MTTRNVSWIAGALALLLAAAAGAASKPGAPPAGPFGEQVDVRVVNVEVVVTDSAGQRVPGLAAGDFRLRVDGREVPVQYFSEIAGGQAILPSAQGGKAPVVGLPSLRPGTPVGTSYLVFVDDYFALAPRRNETLRSLEENLATLGPEDRMAVVAFDGQALTLLSSWSQDPGQLRRALDAAIARPTQGLKHLAALRGLDASRAVGAPAGLDASGVTGASFGLEDEAYIEALAGDLDRTVAAVVSTLRGAAAPPGRKVALLLAGGWPYDPIDYVVDDVNRPILSREGIKSGQDFLRPLIDTANRLGYTLYPVDVPGNDAETLDPSASAQMEGPVGSTGGRFDDPLSPMVPSLPSIPVARFDVRQQEEEATLLYAAEQTGGRALLNGNRLGALAEVAGDTRSYYWLGFTPSFKGNDERHDIRVAVDRPGLKARFREGFLDLSRQAESTLQVESALLFGAPAAAGPRLLVELGKPVKAGRNVVEVPVTLEVPTSAVTSFPVDGGQQVAELELRGVALDRRGNRSDIPMIPLRLVSRHPPAPGHFARYKTTLKLRNIEQRLVLAVSDLASGQMITAEADFQPGKS